MISQKEAVEEIIDCWKRGEHQDARFLVKTYQYILSPKIYKYLYEKTGIIEPEIIPDIVFQAQNILGGKVFNQYGIEVSDPRIKDRGLVPKFGK